MNKFILALIAITSISSIHATSLVRRAATHLASNRFTKAMAKPVSWSISKITQTNFYKKHPWLVKGAGACLAIVAAKKALAVYKDYCMRQQAQQPQALLEAAKLGQLEKVKALIKAGAPLNRQDNRGHTALHWAAKNGNLETVQTLIATKANLDLQNNVGETPLYTAINKYHLKTAQALIVAGAHLNIQNNHGNTALHRATYRGHFEIIKALIAAKADLNIQSHHGNTALHWAVGGVGDFETVQALIKAGAGINIQDNDGYTALHRAAGSTGNFEIVQALIKAGANLNTRDLDHHTALYWAAYYGHLVIVQTLIDADADIDADKINQLANLANKEAAWKIIEERRKNVSTLIDNAIHLDPQNISQLITNYLVPARPTNAPAQDESGDEDMALIRANAQVESKQNHAQAHSNVEVL